MGAFHIPIVNASEVTTLWRYTNLFIVIIIQGRSQGEVLGVLGPPNPIPLKIIKDKTCRPYTLRMHCALS